MPTAKIPLISITNINSTGDVSTIASYLAGTYTLAQTVNGLKGVALPTLASGNLRFNGSAWVFDNTSYIPTSAEGVAGGVAQLDGGGKVPFSQLPASLVGAVHYVGVWNASTNTPALGAASANPGAYYIVSVAGTYLSVSYNVGDNVISDGTNWDKIDNNNAVASVFGRTGAVVANGADYSAFYLPLSAGISYPLTGILYANAATSSTGAIVAGKAALGTWNDGTNNYAWFGATGQNQQTSGNSGFIQVYSGTSPGTIYVSAPSSQSIHMQINSTNILDIGSAGVSVSSGTLTVSGLNVDGIVLNSSLGVLSTSPVATVMANYLLSATAASTYLTIANAATTYQPLNAKLTSISSLANASGALTNNGSGTFSYVAYITGVTLTGDVTGSGTSSIATSIAAGTVTGKVLTGYSSSSNTAIAATDTILAAFGKTQAQINARVSSVGLTGAGPIGINGSPITSSGTMSLFWNGDNAHFVLSDGSTVTTATYLTVSTAAATYLPLAGGRVTGNLAIDPANTTNDFIKLLSSSYMLIRGTAGGTYAAINCTSSGTVGVAPTINIVAEPGNGNSVTTANLAVTGNISASGTFSTSGGLTANTIIASNTTGQAIRTSYPSIGGSNIAILIGSIGDYLSTSQAGLAIGVPSTATWWPFEIQKAGVGIFSVKQSGLTTAINASIGDGTGGAGAGYAQFAHSSMMGTTGFALAQSSTGQTWLNASSGNNVSFSNNNGAAIASFAASLITLVQPVVANNGLTLSSGQMINMTQSAGVYGVAGGVWGQVGDNDWWGIRGGSTASDSGYLEIATGDGGTEPIYVRQYTGTYSSTSWGTPARTAILLDASGNTSFPGTITSNVLTAGGIVKANGSGTLGIASVADINSGMGYGVPVTGDGVYTIANGSRLNGIFHIHWEASNRAEDLVVQCSASQFGNATITVLSYNSYSANNSISNVSIYQASGGATVYLTVTLGNRNSGTNSIGVTYFGGSAGMGFLGSYSGAAIASVTTVPNNSLATSNNAVIGGSLTANATGTAISAPNGDISTGGVYRSGVYAPTANFSIASATSNVVYVNTVGLHLTIPSSGVTPGTVFHLCLLNPTVIDFSGLTLYNNGSTASSGSSWNGNAEYILTCASATAWYIK